MPTKLLCFTRSSPFLRQIPSEYPSAPTGTSIISNQIDFLQKYVWNDFTKLMVCKLSSKHSQSSLENLINTFIQSEREIVIFIIDTGTHHQPSLEQRKKMKENINHLRMMIEEAETLSSSSSIKKMFVLLVHFPPAELLAKDPCYPSLFLQGWDHIYLDSIADGTFTRSGTTASVVNIKHWLHRCLVKSPLPSSIDSLQGQMFTEFNVDDIVKDAIPTVASKISLRAWDKTSHDTFILRDTPLSVSEKTSALEYILLSSDDETDSPGRGAGAVLARCFSRYWNSQVMNHYLHKIASFTISRQSTLNLTASVQSTFRSIFFDFLVYNISHLEKTQDLYILLNKETDPGIISALLELMEVLPQPELEQLSQTYPLPVVQEVRGNDQRRLPSFPFIHEIIDIIEGIIEESSDVIRHDHNKELAPGRKVSQSFVSISQQFEGKDSNLHKLVRPKVSERQVS